MSELKNYGLNIKRQSEADDTQAISFARDFIKFGQWLNAGGIAAMPVIAGILELKGASAQNVMYFPPIFFRLD